MRVTRAVSAWPAPYRGALLWASAALGGGVLAGVLLWLVGPLALFVAIPLAGLLIACGGFLIVLGARDAWINRRRPLVAAGRVLIPVLVVAAGAASPFRLMGLGSDGATWAWFLTHRATYLEIARQIESGAFKPAEKYEQDAFGTRFIIDDGPPKRVAFPLFGGFLDNWRGIVRDPTGVVAKARFRKPGEPGPDDLEMMFGGQMVRCRPMTDDFYDCDFT